jgi:hypothetical protein
MARLWAIVDKTLSLYDWGHDKKWVYGQLKLFRKVKHAPKIRIVELIIKPKKVK